MDNILPPNFHHMSRSEQVTFLEANADEVKRDEIVTKQIDSAQREAFKERYVDHSIKLAILKEKKKEMMAEHEEGMKPHKEAVKNLTSVLRNGIEEIESDVYMIRDHENERVYTYLPTGEKIDDRRMLPNERQSTVQGSMRSIK